MSELTKKTTDHDTIRRWADERDGRPASVADTVEAGEPGVLTIHFPGQDARHDRDLTDLTWDEFFRKFEAEQLAFLYQEQTADGDTSRFFKLVRR
ncbi:MAG TPA: hypothetical protein VG452_04375 [Egibacteraceae bacterium]|nr:hypothetical protein [Actinomycetota bacterium]HWB71432.1 hypothetical protein [Egibacteraceae bacterium]